MNNRKLQMKEYNKKYKELHKDEIKKYRDEHKEYQRVYFIEYRKKNREAILAEKKIYYQEHKEEYLMFLRKYRTTEKGKAITHNDHYKRRTLQNNGDVTSEQLAKLIKETKKCYWCGCSLNKKIKIHIDHYIPLSGGGEHTLKNIVISCSTCNLSKGKKDPLYFANSMGRLL